MSETAAIDRFIEQQMAANHVPGLALGITQGNKVLYVKGYGTAGHDQPVTPRTQFYLASLSKSFTAAAVMQLVEAGRIDLDTPVSSYLPSFTLADSDAAREITVRHLLNQTTGLSDLGFPEMVLPQPNTLVERVTSLRDAHLVSKPGTAYHYFNPNYGVLARIVEVTSGERFSDSLHAHLFVPLNMRHTMNIITSAETERVAENLAQGYIVAYGLQIPSSELSGYLGGSGGVISTAEDMVNYLIMQNNGGRFGNTTLLTPESVTLMHTPPKEINSPYAMGWMVMNPNQEPRVIEHNGNLATFHSDAALLPEKGYGIVLLYNDNYMLSGFETIKQGVIDLLQGKQPSAGNWNVSIISSMLGILTLLTVVVQVRSLLRLSRWVVKAKNTSAWRHVPGLIWAFTPAGLLIALPRLTAAFTGRVFGYVHLFFALPDIVVWLGLSAVLGASLGTARIALLVRRRRGSRYAAG